MGMWKASRAPVQKGLKIRDPTSPHSGTLIWVLGCPPLTSYRTLPKLFNLVSLSFYFYKMGVRRAHSSPQFVDHKSPAGGSCLQLSHVNVCLGLGGVGEAYLLSLVGPESPCAEIHGLASGDKKHCVSWEEGSPFVCWGRGLCQALRQTFSVQGSCSALSTACVWGLSLPACQGEGSEAQKG